MFLINFYHERSIDNLKHFSLFIISMLLVSCGGESTSTPVTANSTPTLSSISAQSTLQGVTKTVSITASDSDGDSLTYTLTSDPVDKVTGSVSGSTLTLTPDSSYSGTASLTLKVSDGESDVSQTFTLAVNAAPVAAAALTMTFTPAKIFRFTWTGVSDATSYKLKEAINAGSGYTLINETTTSSFEHVVPLYARLNAKYILESCNAHGCTASVAVFTSTKVAEMASSIEKFNGSGWTVGNYFGASVSLSNDGYTMAVGAQSNNSSETGINGNQNTSGANTSGAVYIYTRSGTSWFQQAFIKASNTGIGDFFGRSVSLSDDGNTLAVGAPQEDSNATGINGDQTDNSVSFAGAVYAFTRSGSTWSQQAYIKASNTARADHFGNAVSLSGDGNTLAVGAFYEDSNVTGINGIQSDISGNNQGAVYTFFRTGTNWLQQAYIKASDAGTHIHENFGYSVSLSVDGNTLAVSNPMFKLYVFIRSGSSWSQQAYVKPSNWTNASDPLDLVGNSVSLSADGNTLAIGRKSDPSNATGINGDQTDSSAGGSGAVYIYTRSGTIWSQQAYIKASNVATSDQFGYSVSLSADGNGLAVGAIGEDSNTTGINSDQTNNSASSSGAAYVFTRSGTSWSQQAYVKAIDTGAGDSFGQSVSLSGDGSTLAVGAWANNSTYSNSDRVGAAYIY